MDTQGIPDSDHDAALVWSLTYSSTLLPTSKSSEVRREYPLGGGPTRETIRSTVLT